VLQEIRKLPSLIKERLYALVHEAARVR
jgi:hypothetical protein